jgi:hypothetical protein
VLTGYTAILFLLALSVSNRGGDPDATTVFPQQMQVDYVRVYDRSYGRLVGAKQVEAGQTGVVYSLADGLDDFTIEWEVPLGAAITGQTSTSITVAFGTSSGGLVTATAVTSSCGGINKSFTIPVVVNSATSTEVGACGDGVDNDSDGLTDCDDSDCAADPACACSPSPEDCVDGIDNDCDGLVDCDDTDCAGDAACTCSANGSSCGADLECCSDKCRGGECR